MISSTVGGSGGYRDPLLRGETPRWKLDLVAGERRRPARSSNDTDSITSSYGRWLTPRSSSSQRSSSSRANPAGTPMLEPRGQPSVSARNPAGRPGHPKRRQTNGRPQRPLPSDAIVPMATLRSARKSLIVVDSVVSSATTAEQSDRP